MTSSGDRLDTTQRDQRDRLRAAREALREITAEIRRRESGRESGQAAAAASPRWPIASAPGALRVREAGPGPAAAVEAPGGAPDPLVPLCELEYAVVDVETTGTSPRMGDRITEVAVVCVSGRGEVLGEFTSLVNPGRPIPPYITRLTNITDRMVEGAPSFRALAPGLDRILAGRIFVAHNAAFDWRFLGEEYLAATGAELRATRLCTVRLARRLLPELPRRSLDAVTTYFNVPVEGRHRAWGDARATAAVLLRLFERAGERDVACWGALEELLSAPRPRRRRSSLPRSAESA